MTLLNDLKILGNNLIKQDYIMPIMFVGHGSPMNAIEDNEFSREWSRIGNSLVKPQAILSISAHWLTKGSFVTAMEKPRTIHDCYGFPKELFDVNYPAPGNPQLASKTQLLINKTKVKLDQEWGLDHGTWSVIRKMYPGAEIPVLQLSIDYTKDLRWHFELAKELFELRKKGILILGSGNLVHNLKMLNWQNPEGIYEWAEEINEKFKENISSNNYNKLINYDELGTEAKLAIPSPDHYIPMLYILGLLSTNEQVSYFNDKTVLGSISMTSFVSVK